MSGPHRDEHTATMTTKPVRHPADGALTPPIIGIPNNANIGTLNGGQHMAAPEPAQNGACTVRRTGREQTVADAKVRRSCCRSSVRCGRVGEHTLGVEIRTDAGYQSLGTQPSDTSSHLS
jgi:hypothetical protein